MRPVIRLYPLGELLAFRDQIKAHQGSTLRELLLAAPALALKELTDDLLNLPLNRIRVEVMGNPVLATNSRRS
jgi:hypothetical protein